MLQNARSPGVLNFCGPNERWRGSHAGRGVYHGRASTVDGYLDLCTSYRLSLCNVWGSRWERLVPPLSFVLEKDAPRGAVVNGRREES